jgi:ectoine hydroxylase-related dioxygenase (phytanoyl-CoA dioxygenase family)
MSPSTTVSAWLALTPCSRANGCLRVIPGTQHTLLPHGKADKAGNILGNNQEIDPAAIDETKAIDLELVAGQASLHHGLTVHGSNPNRSGRRRCGMTLRFTTPDVKPVAGVFVDKPILISGEDRYGHFAYLPKPAFANQAEVSLR